MYSNNDDCFIVLVTKSALISRPSENAPQACSGQALLGSLGLQRSPQTPSWILDLRGRDKGRGNGKRQEGREMGEGHR